MGQRPSDWFAWEVTSQGAESFPERRLGQEVLTMISESCFAPGVVAWAGGWPPQLRSNSRWARGLAGYLPSLSQTTNCGPPHPTPPHIVSLETAAAAAVGGGELPGAPILGWVGGFTNPSLQAPDTPSTPGAASVRFRGESSALREVSPGSLT